MRYAGPLDGNEVGSVRPDKVASSLAGLQEQKRDFFENERMAELCQNVESPSYHGAERKRIGRARPF